MERHCLIFGPFRLNGTNGTLLRDGKPLPVGQRGISLLKVLLQRRGEVLTKAELLDAAWPGMAIEESNLSVQIMALRKVLGPTPNGGEWIVTIPKVGYRFVPEGDDTAGSAGDRPWWFNPRGYPLDLRWAAVMAAVALLVVVGFMSLRPAQVTAPLVAWPNPTIAVLPFDDMTGNAELNYFGAGVSGDIISMLARVPNFTVVALSSSFRYRGQTVDVRTIGEELGATHVLEGSVRKDAERVRIVAQLIDARTGNHVWAERFDRSGTDPWALQDEVTEKIVAALVGPAGMLAKTQFHEAWGKDSANLEEYDYFLRGLGLDLQNTPETTEQAIAILKEGLSKLPHANSLKAALAAVFVARHSRGFSESPNPQDDFRRAGRLAREALAEPRAAPLIRKLGHFVLAYVNLAERKFDEALAHAEAALALSPYDGTWVYFLAEIPILSGRPNLAHEWIEQAAALYPEDDPRQQPLLAMKGYALWADGKPDEALTALSNATGVLPAFLLLRAHLLVGFDRVEEARADIGRVLEADPTYTLAKHRRKYFYLDSDWIEPILETLAFAGLPEL